jgi:hypothetical protein
MTCILYVNDRSLLNSQNVGHLGNHYGSRTWPLPASGLWYSSRAYVAVTLATVSGTRRLATWLPLLWYWYRLRFHLLNYPSSRFFTISGSLPSLDQHDPHQYLLISSPRRSSMFPFILVLCPLALAATFSPRQDLPEGATTLVVFEETTSSETYVHP